MGAWLFLTEVSLRQGKPPAAGRRCCFTTVGESSFHVFAINSSARSRDRFGIGAPGRGISVRRRENRRGARFCRRGGVVGRSEDTSH
uniref:Uncharacterized protein n=1 Tax=Zea mays TaxID=4577 RepID=B4G1R0_MAIZE|nr:unknown [Zea mays]